MALSARPPLMMRGRFGLLATYLVLGFAYASLMGFVFMQYVFYDSMLLVLDINNSQLGFLMTVEGAGAMLFAIPGGIAVDRWRCESVFLVSTLVSAACAIGLAVVPSYPAAIAAWAVLSVTLCGFYPAIFKIVRIVESEDRSGRSFGMFGFCNAIAFMVVNYASLALYHAFDPRTGFSLVLVLFAAVMVLSGGAGFRMLRSRRCGPATFNDDDSERVELGDIKTVLKMPGTWLVFIVGFVINSMHITLGYFTPYLTGVMGVAVHAGGALAVLRQYGVRLISAPVGGAIGDRIDSNTTVVGAGLAFCSLALAFIIFHSFSSALLAFAVMMLLALADNLLMSLCYSIFGEALIPPRYTGTVIGVITVILPDLFIPALFGSWLDAFGNTGYTLIFGFTIALNLLGVSCAWIIMRRYRGHQRMER